ncbi:protein lin-54 homolog [Teleopsis dalmanni]|uniref:protein lin-54 homolog n=1 Tax=Teleopsis dalmanni TaxID=139649 RepID=UPI0018CFC2BA|nr:protein lin-54 homolog [Teleopsis dalmanni]
MDTNAAPDNLNDTPILPEISFEDLLEESPIKKIPDNQLDSPIEESKKLPGDDSLHTPGSKKSIPQIKNQRQSKDVIRHEKIVPITTQADDILITPDKPKIDKVETSKVITTIINTTHTTTTAKFVKSIVSLNSGNRLTSTNKTITGNSAIKLATVPSNKITNSPILLNAKNILPKSTTATTNHIIKISPKALGSSTPLTLPVGKTAVKTANGQILYIQKTSGIRLQTPTSTVKLAKAATLTVSTTVTTSTTSTATPVTSLNRTGSTPSQKTQISLPNTISKATPTVTTTNSTTPSNNTPSKTFSIQVVRTSSGKFLPVKSSIPTLTTVTSTTSSNSILKKNPISLNTSIATKLGTSKVIPTSSGQMIIKTPLKNAISVSSNTTTGVTTTSNEGTKIVKIEKQPNTSGAVTPISNVTAFKMKNAPMTSTAGKILVNSATGKQIMVSSQNLIKLSPKMVTSVGGQGKAATIINLNNLKTLQLPTKITRVLPLSTASVNGTTTINTATTSSGNIIATPPAATIVATTAVTIATTTTTITTSTVGDKLVSSSSNTSSTSAALSTKTTMASTTAPTIKILNSLPQKFTVLRPNTTKFFVTQTSKKSGVLPVAISASGLGMKSLIQNNALERKVANTSMVLNKQFHSYTPVGGDNLSLLRKNKISQINSEIHKITSSVNEKNQPEIKTIASGKHIVIMPRPLMRPGTSGIQRHGYIQRVGVLSADSSPSQVQKKKLFSVLKNNAQHSDVKSLIICGQAKAIMAQQQQHKALPIKDSELVQSKKLMQFVKVKKEELEPEEHQLQQHKVEDADKHNILSHSKLPTLKIKQEIKEDADVKPFLEDNGVVRRKHCNCSKSQCLKLYCDCFANGEFCQDCTCKDCFNNLQYQDERQRAIKSCLERNPSAFKPKITSSRDQSDTRLHNKGCNCKRSGCLKNYCECYEAKISCSSNCKCVGCRNIEERPDLDMDPIDTKLLQKINETHNQISGRKRIHDDQDKKDAKRDRRYGVELDSGSNSNSCDGLPPIKQQCNIITQEVVDATIQCMLSQADESIKNGMTDTVTERLIMEEMGRCLVEIIDFSIRNNDSSYMQE